MKHRVFVFLSFIIYILAMTALMIWQGVGIAPDRYAFVLLLGSLLVKRTRQFIFDWIPFLFLLISYDFLRGFADNFLFEPHYQELINAEISLFGSLPTVTLQRLLYDPPNLNWYDFMATVLYFLHFALPLAFGYLLWIFNRQHFREFVVAILILSYSGWITYVAYPAAPPWLARKEGYISGITKIMDQTLNVFPEKLQLPTIYHRFNPNPVAAIPSLHSAYPFLVFLFALRYFHLKALFFSPYVLAVWFSIVYLGEHYVVDVLAGIAYAFVAFLLTTQILYKTDWTKIANKFYYRIKYIYGHHDHPDC